MDDRPYNPLEKINLARSIEAEILSRNVRRLDGTDPIRGTGVYAIYYHGDFTPYRPISGANAEAWRQPIYVGKAIPKGGRKGGIGAQPPRSSTRLAERLRKHMNSIRAAENLRVEDFVFRYLVLDDIWIPLGENMLIETFRPLWNVVVEGFGINAPGEGRTAQKRSSWDVLHPGRTYAARLTGGGAETESILGRIDDHFAGRPLRPLPRALADETPAADDEDIDGA